MNFSRRIRSSRGRHAGDVIKFAGDAILSIWSASAADESLETLTLRAVSCALEQVEKMHNWDTGEGIKLQLHLGLGAGTMRGVDLGNHMRREFVVAGDALKQLSDAEQQASSGQLVVSPQAWALGACGLRLAARVSLAPTLFTACTAHSALVLKIAPYVVVLLALPQSSILVRARRCMPTAEVSALASCTSPSAATHRS